MARRFKLENLPKDVREKINYIDFTPEEEEIMGFVALKDGWCFDWDGSHIEGFSDRNDLISIIRDCTTKEE